MRKAVVVTMLVGVLLCSAALAQRMGPPKIIQIGRETVKTGKGVAHAKYEAQWTQAMLKAKYTRPYLGMTSMNSNEAWWVTGFESYADLEKESNNTAFSAVSEQFGPGDAEYISDNRTIIARYREDLSYGVDQPLGAAHGFFVRTTRVRLGHDSEYAELRKTVKDAVESGHVSGVRSAVFQVTSGAPNGTYLIFSAFTSLAERDTPNEAMAAAMRDLGSKINDLATKAILSSEDQVFMFNPKFSNPPPQMAAAAPDFWKPKAAMAKAAMPAGDKAATAAKPAEKSKAKTGQ